ncbi:hypothetical protein FGL74_03045 [Leuconostoc koreense]|nr:hypothetical protein FGL74_03045 [Leuconostoc mesenteroides]QGM24652.1 hypothetical protein GJV51_01025 [Leuconostoc mesenteroides subsp. mesenteroides]
MQNYIIQHQFQAPLHHLLQKLIQYVASKKSVSLKRQLNAQEIIIRLELALNTTDPVTIQLNDSLFSEHVTQLYGYMYQNNHGQLFIQSHKTHKFSNIAPGMIRHISFS